MLNELGIHRQVAIAGELPEEMTAMLWKAFEPNRVVLYANAQAAALQPALGAMTAPEAGGAVYLCENFACLAPVSTAEDLARVLRAPPPKLEISD